MPRTTPRFDLSPIDFLETSSDVIQSELINEYESVTGRTLAQGDPVRLFLNAIAARMTQLSEAFNLAAKNNLLSYATGEYLDAMGEYVNTPRLQSSGASVTMKFTLNQPVQDSVYQIPKGTLVTDGSITFATDELATIAVGENTTTVTATATEKGTFANGLTIGSIKTLVEPLQNIQSVENTDISSGGSDIEDDESYAQRIKLAPASFSVAGPQGAYEYHALKFSGSIIDVSIYGLTTNPGNVYIHPLLTSGALPNEAFVEQLKNYLSGDSIRPLTDNLVVSAPTAVDYSIKLKWFLSQENIPKIQQITKAVEVAVEEYRSWQQSKIGRDLTPDELIKKLMQAGVKRVEIESPVFTTISQSQVAQCTGTQIDFGGSEES